MEWLTIYDQKPSTGQTVLILLSSGKCTIGKYDGIYFTDDGLLIENITHWCPIPDINSVENIKPYNYEDVLI